MQKKVILLFAIVTWMVSSCHTVKTTPVSQESIQKNIQASNLTKKPEKQREDIYYQRQKRGVDFFASGNEPFWSLEINFGESIKLTTRSGIDSLQVPISDPILVMDAPMVNYKGSSEQGEVMVSIELHECVNNMSGIKKPYVVRISAKKANDQVYTELKGCGEYYGDIRLHDVWSLSSINGILVGEFKFDRHPYMELYLNSGRVSGFLGCNSFSTQFFFGQDQIFFKHVRSTKMACPALGFEQKFAKAISNSLLNYRFDGLNLILENNADTLVFKKVN